MAQQYGYANSLQVQLAGPFGAGGGGIKLTEVTLPALGWKGAEGLYRQTVTVDGISRTSMVQLHLTAAQLMELRDFGIGLTAENTEGVVTVYALGACPAADLTIQASITEVIA